MKEKLNNFVKKLKMYIRTWNDDYYFLVNQKYKPKIKDIYELFRLLLTFRFIRFYYCIKYIINYFSNKL